MKTKLCYLAGPYSHSKRAVREQRFQAVCRAAAAMIRDGHIIYSPIAHSHPICTYGKLPGDWLFWKEQDLWHLERCDEVVVLKLDGWQDSRGVQEEMALAMKLGKPISLMDPCEEPADAATQDEVAPA